MTVGFLWILFLAGIALQLGALTVAIRALSLLGVILWASTIIGAVMVSLAVAWGILGEIATKL